MGLRECREAAGVTRIQAAYELHLSPEQYESIRAAREHKLAWLRQQAEKEKT